MPDLKLPDGRIVKNIPEGISKQQIEQKLLSSGYLTGDEKWLTPKMSIGEAAFITATNPLGFGDEIKAGIAAGVAKLFGGAATQNIDIGDLYREARTSERAKLEKARQDRPLTSFAGQVFSDVGVAGKGLKALGLTGQGFGTAVKSSGVIGGATALGETEDITNIPQTLKDVAEGVVVGGVIGGGVQKATPIINQAIDKSLPFIKSSAERFKKTTPETIMSKVLKPEEALQEATKLGGKIQEGRITTLPEQGNEAILGLTRILGKTQGSNKIISNYINNKTASSARRVGDIINNNLSAENYFDTLDNTIVRRKEISAPLYQQAEIEGQKYLDKILKPKKIFVSKPIIGANGEALTDPATGVPLTKIVKENAPPKILYDNPNITKYVNMAKNEPLFVDPRLSNNSFVVLKGAKEMIDRDINLAVKNQDFTTSKALYGVKRQVLDILEKASPSYKEANKIYAGETALKNAQEEGLKFNQYRNGEEVKRAFSKLSDGEKEAYKIGVKDYLMDKVAKSSDRNPAKTIFGNQLERRKIQALFDNPKQFTDFTKRLNDEIRVFDTKQRVLGGSRTDFNLEEQNQLLDKIAKGAINAKTFGVSDILLMTKNAIQKRYYGLNEQTAKELANIIIDPEKSVNLLNNVYKKAQTKTEKGLIQKFIQDFLEKRNFIKTLSPQIARTMVSEQPKNEENLE
jgi:hypothetical protein